MLGFAGGQALRLASTLILSRLLFPEAYGLAALVAIFTQGLVMLSDVGIQQSVVQSARGNDPRFLNTAWTLQVVRGVVLWCIAVLLTWPMAAIYREPELLYLLPVGSLAVVIGGLASTSLFTMRRSLAVAQLVRIELGSQLAGLAVIVAWAYYSPTVWAIVAGGLVNGIVKSIASHWVDVGYRNRFDWDPTAKDAIVQFGKWIFGSSALSFVSRQSDRLLLGHFMGMAALGVYSIAFFISDALGTAVTRITHGVLFPVFSQISREDPAKLSNLYYKARLRLDLLGLVPVGAVMMLAQPIVDILYDPRYSEAGWMLQALCLRVAMSNVLVPAESCLFSIGHTYFGFRQNIGRALWIVCGVPLAWFLWGIKGVVWATATSEIPVLFILWHGFHRHGLLAVAMEARALVFFGTGLLIGYGGDHLLDALAREYGWVF
jgi:O-antigen/teichoic acid export membrane protein